MHRLARLYLVSGTNRLGTLEDMKEYPGSVGGTLFEKMNHQTDFSPQIGAMPRKAVHPQMLCLCTLLPVFC